MGYPFAGISGVHWRFTMMFVAWSVGSIIVGVVCLWSKSKGMDAALADATGWQSIIWGGINLVFALNGVRTHRAFDETASRKLIGYFRTSGWMNAMWIGTGVVLIALQPILGEGWAGPLMWHGLNVVVQAIFLTVFDVAFKGALVRVTRDAARQ
jgi:hypothetical protein